MTRSRNPPQRSDSSSATSGSTCPWTARSRSAGTRTWWWTRTRTSIASSSRSGSGTGCGGWSTSAASCRPPPPKEKAASRAGWPGRAPADHLRGHARALLGRSDRLRAGAPPLAAGLQPRHRPLGRRGRHHPRPGAPDPRPKSSWYRAGEPALRPDGSGRAHLPTSAEAATRLGWALTKFNRKLDNVCQSSKTPASGVCTADRIASPRTGEVGSSNTPSPSACYPRGSSAARRRPRRWRRRRLTGTGYRRRVRRSTWG